MQIIAHRGDSGAHPELTHIAFKSALELGAPAVECDVRLTKDGKLVCVHDSDIERVSNGTGRVENMNYADLRAYNFGTPEEPQEPLLFEDLVALLQEYPDRHLYIEAKHPSRYGKMVEEQIVRKLNYAQCLDDPRMHFISFSPLAIRTMQMIAPQLDRIVLRDDKPSLSWKAALRWCQPHGLGMSIEAAKANPAELDQWERTYLWTVDEPSDMLWARDHGVDMLATNYPALALRTVS